MLIKRFVVGPLETNCYLVACQETLDAILIDAGFSEESDALSILKEIEVNSLNVNCVLSTHWHPDHTSGNEYVRRKLGASILIHKDDAQMLNTEGFLLGFRVKPHKPDRTLAERDFISVGRTRLKVVHTPGHTEGSICLLGEGFVFTGDTLFAGSIGRTDLPGGSFEEIISSIRTKLIVLPDETLVYPGHGSPSSIGRERRTNLFLRSL
ncbi:MAG: MBL fold metallo-hydrolase [Thermoproteota archaeon]